MYRTHFKSTKYLLIIAAFLDGAKRNVNISGISIFVEKGVNKTLALTEHCCIILFVIKTNGVVYGYGD